MPVLSVYIGTNQQSFLYLDSTSQLDTTKVVSFPYVYSENLFGSSLSEKEYYAGVVDYVTRQMRVSSKKVDTIITGFPKSCELELLASFCAPLSKVLPSVREYSHIYLTNSVVIKNGTVGYYTFLPDHLSAEENNFYANLDIYPFLVPANDTEVLHHDKLSRFISLGIDVDFSSDNPIILTGDRIAESDYNDLTNMLALDLIRTPGIFDVRMDNDNLLPHIAMLRTFDSEFKGLADHVDFKRLGTLLNAGGPVECLYESGAGTSQLIEMSAERLFVLPQNQDTEARIVAKSDKIGHIEKKIKGGELGFVIDTRDKSSTEFMSNNVKSARQWEKVLSEVEGNL
jgi:hypothetical protein